MKVDKQEAFRVLLEDGDGSTPLLEAAARGYTAVAQILLDTGAQANAKTSSRDGGRTALIIAAENGHADTARVLLDHGADVNVASSQGATSLSKAAAVGHKEQSNAPVRATA